MLRPIRSIQQPLQPFNGAPSDLLPTDQHWLNFAELFTGWSVLCSAKSTVVVLLSLIPCARKAHAQKETCARNSPGSVNASNRTYCFSLNI